MSTSIINRQVRWKDLTEYSVFETIRELSLPIIWFTAALAAMNFSIIVTAICTGYTFLFGLRVAHNSFHRALGLPAWANNWVMMGISWILIGSAHAIYVTHLYHHKHCLEDEDVEGQLARYPFWRALSLSPLYPFQIHIKALKICSPSIRRWIGLELVTSATLHLVIMPTIFGPNYFIYLSIMAFANLIAPMFGIWLVHRDCDNPAKQARSCRSTILNFLSGNMLYHHEHHLFPGVPSRKMRELSSRIDLHAKTSGLMIF